ncbi:hypothetical protein FHS61_000989 [Altererythrobacter atlanticus]|uniref:Uncharacterized protein n=1 Tax=Croceibacterium atlanticum TaxID=1267766 RepID=A0A0F7KUL6_9SPHN|nr:hypothetical protein [Croceibacterium atlanticum]AKH43309.1 hypothetical protein WYH_02277 [Croceibacterium atlanticum]MBB5731985.1 hypothetical protein [Croceibacterium atlanticum]
MAILLMFLLGIGNFALQRAVLESRHRLLRELPPLIRKLGGRASLVAEFCLLLGAMLLVGNGYPEWGWAYLGYTALNAFSAWILLSNRI